MPYFASDAETFNRLNADAHASNCVGGWMVQRAEYETLYAVHPDRVVYRIAKRPNANFRNANARWLVCDGVPGGAEWIGAY